MSRVCRALGEVCDGRVRRWKGSSDERGSRGRRGGRRRECKDLDLDLDLD